MPPAVQCNRLSVTLPTGLGPYSAYFTWFRFLKSRGFHSRFGMQVMHAFGKHNIQVRNKNILLLFLTFLHTIGFSPQCAGVSPWGRREN